MSLCMICGKSQNKWPQLGDGFHHPSSVIQGMVYNWVYHIMYIHITYIYIYHIYIYHIYIHNTYIYIYSYIICHIYIVNMSESGLCMLAKTRMLPVNIVQHQVRVQVDMNVIFPTLPHPNPVKRIKRWVEFLVRHRAYEKKRRKTLRGFILSRGITKSEIIFNTKSEKLLRNLKAQQLSTIVPSWTTGWWHVCSVVSWVSTLLSHNPPTRHSRDTIDVVSNHLDPIDVKKTSGWRLYSQAALFNSMFGCLKSS